MDQGRLEASATGEWDPAAMMRVKPSAEPRVKLNLGCGSRKFDGFINVDKYGEPDQRVDLEQFPWPWMDSVADEVVLIHVLEHLGETSAGREKIIRELYRVCAPGALVKIVVPHHAHANFKGDPTHVWPVNHQQMTLLDREQCEAWQAAGYANTPLALYWGVDFKIVWHQEIPDEPYVTMLAEKILTFDELNAFVRERNNVIAETHLTLEVRK